MNFSEIAEYLSGLGFPMNPIQVGNVVADLNNAIALGKVKRSTAPDRNRYPLRHIIALLTDKRPDNYNLTWIDAVHKCPILDEYRSRASYSQNVTQQKSLKCGVTSLDLMGVVLLAAVLKHNPSAGIDRQPTALDKLADLRETLRASSASTQDTLDRAREYVDSTAGSTLPATRKYIIYVLRDSGNKAIKIGITDDLAASLATYKSDCPFLFPIAYYPVESLQTEKKLFARLQKWAKSQAMLGWFDDRVEMLQELADFFLMQPSS